MSRITPTLARLQAQGRKALIPYVTAGFPYADITPALMHALVEGGADVIELGVPFSDPSADGPVIQKAGERALAAGIGMTQVLDMVRAFRQTDTTTPVVLMGYANPVERYNQIHSATKSQADNATATGATSPFVQDAVAAGVDGVLVVDYPPEECEDFAAELRAQGLDLIFLLAPTSTDARMAQVARVASGYVYYVSLKGVTGSGALDTGAVAQMLPRIRAQMPHLPMGVGFGIRDAATAQAIGAVADAVIIGTRLIQLLEPLTADAVTGAARAFMHDIRQALDS
jgi:tryptophan synthase alpha chain